MGLKIIKFNKFKKMLNKNSSKLKMNYSILFCVLVFSLAQKWEPYKELWSGGSHEIMSKASYMDSGSGMLHIIFVEQIFEKYHLHEARINSEMKAEEVSYLMQDICIIMTEGSISINGPGNGRDVYIVAVGKQNAGYDIFFIESHDGGNTWTEAVIPRKDGLRDDHYRYFPRLVADSSGKIWIFYKRDDKSFAFVTRKSGSTIWEEEQEIAHPKCPFKKELKFIRANAMETAKSQDTIVVSYRCPDDSQIIISETEDGTNWRHYEDTILQKYYGEDFYTSYNKETKRLFFSKQSDGFDYKYQLCWLFEYKPGGKRIKLSLENDDYINQGIMTQVHESGQWSLIFLLSPYYMNTEDIIKCMKINMDKPWITTPFPIPELGGPIKKLEFNSYSSYLFAEGINDKYIISVARLKF